MTLTRRLRHAAAVGAAAIAVPVIAGAATSDRVATYRAASGLQTTGLRPTAVGLPQLGAAGTTGAKELPAALRQYHDSGRYADDLEAVGGAARAELKRRLRSPKGRRSCRRRYVAVKGTPRRYRRTRVCSTVAAIDGKPAIVLDIDETSLSNYAGLEASGFSAAGTAGPAAGGTGTAIAPTLALYRYARKHGVAVFFITGRPDAIGAATERNLKGVGYDRGWTGLRFRPAGEATRAYKAGARKAIEKRGYDVLVNVGDQESDLDGGHADRAFKLPNPFYFIAG